MTPLKRPKYIWIKMSDIPEEFKIKYNLHKLATPDGSMYIQANKSMYGLQANKGMYGLPQSGLLANEFLEKRLNEHGYQQSQLVPGL